MSEISRLVERLEAGRRRQDLTQALDALHSLLGMSGDAGASGPAPAGADDLRADGRGAKLAGTAGLAGTDQCNHQPDPRAALQGVRPHVSCSLRKSNQHVSYRPASRRHPLRRRRAHIGKWFARTFGGEFNVVTAAGVGEALRVLGERGHEFAVLVTDYRMPERDGMKLLRAVQRDTAIWCGCWRRPMPRRTWPSPP